MDSTDDRYAPGVRAPDLGEVVGWREVTPDGVIVNWGPPIELELTSEGLEALLAEGAL